MSSEALDWEEQAAINAAFMCNHRGDVCIVFSDPLYARSDSILVDHSDMSIHAILHHHQYFLGNVSEQMMRAFEENEQALLTAIKADGSVLELAAPIEIGTA